MNQFWLVESRPIRLPLIHLESNFPMSLMKFFHWMSTCGLEIISESLPSRIIYSEFARMVWTVFLRTYTIKFWLLNRICFHKHTSKIRYKHKRRHFRGRQLKIIVVNPWKGFLLIHQLVYYFEWCKKYLRTLIGAFSSPWNTPLCGTIVRRVPFTLNKFIIL